MADKTKLFQIGIFGAWLWAEWRESNMVKASRPTSSCGGKEDGTRKDLYPWD
ncbi:hypothetical protein BM1_03535 [Bipolaris maydis]|nr:hypothetical protein BM1_03535 [Bipolaris maydis]